MIAAIMLSFLLYEFVICINSNQMNLGQERLKETAFQGASYVKNIMKIQIEHIRGLASRLSKYESLSHDVVKDFIKDVAKGTQFNYIVVDVLSCDSYTSEGDVSKIKDIDYLKDVEINGYKVTDVLKSSFDNTISIEIICPIMNYGSVAGAVRGVLYPEALRRNLNTMLFDGEGYCTLFDSKGKYLTYSDNYNVLVYQDDYLEIMRKFTFDQGYSIEQLEDNISNGRPNFAAYSFNDEHRYSYSMPIGINNWYFNLVVPKWVIDKNSIDLNKKCITMVFLIAIIFIILAIAFILFGYLVNSMMDEISKNNEEMHFEEKKLDLILKRSEDIFFDYNITDEVTKFSAKFEEVFHRKPIEKGLPLSAIESGVVHPESSAAFIKFFEDIRKGVPVVTEEMRIKDNSGKFIWCLFSSFSFFNKKNIPVKGLGIIEIINDKKEMENKYNEVQKYKSSIDSEYIFKCDINLSKNFYLSGYEEILSTTNIESENNYQNILRLIARDYFHVDNMNELMLKNNPNNLISLFISGTTDPAFEYKITEHDKTEKWLYFRYKLYESPSTKDICAIVSIIDISEQKRKEAELIDKAEKDQMTGLYNKTTTEKLINDWIHNYDSSLGALMIIDIDNFKNVNDMFGHLYGDLVLKKLAEDLKSVFRANDVVGRIGGDEFFVFLKKLYSESFIDEKAKEICRLFHRIFEEKGISCEISSSIGIALFPKHGNTLDELYRNADTALYISKEKGKNNFTIYNWESFKGYGVRTEIDPL